MDFTKTTAPFSQLSLAINFGAEALVSEKLAPGHVFVSRALYHINPTSSAALIRVNPDFLGDRNGDY